MTPFVENFIPNLVNWTNTDRPTYVQKLQEALRDYLSLINNVPWSANRDFASRVKKIWDEDKINLFSIYEFHVNSKGKLSRFGMNMNKLMRAIEKTHCFDVLNLSRLERQKIVDVDLLKILDLAVVFFHYDYKTPLYDTKGLTQILTFRENSSNIMDNHSHEIAFAWLRAKDPLYANETQRAVKTSSNVSPSSVVAGLNVISAQDQPRGDIVATECRVV